eukprot:11215020-Lingulodinium_polyedra.AAC.1
MPQLCLCQHTWGWRRTCRLPRLQHRVVVLLGEDGQHPRVDQGQVPAQVEGPRQALQRSPREAQPYRDVLKALVHLQLLDLGLARVHPDQARA